ncbi:MAG: Mu transposase C-terminal domain-containing protein, partial [Gemmataceae bacterium]
MEYYDQPTSIPLKYEAITGKHLTIWHTPDFFVIRRSSGGWEECKDESELKKLAAKSAYRYQQTDNGWHCPPGEAHANPLGFYYRFRSSAEINWALQQNIQFLEDYWRFQACPVVPAVRRRVRDEVALRPGLRLSDLFCKGKGIASRDDIYRLIASGDLHVNLKDAALVEPEKVRVFSDAEAAAAWKVVEVDSETADRGALVRIAAGSSVRWDGKVWRIINAGERRVSLLGEEAVLTEIPLEAFEELVRKSQIVGAEPDTPSELEASCLVSTAREEDLKVANRRYELVQRRRSGERDIASGMVSERTLRLWMARYREAKDRCGSGYLGLIPKTGERGNRAHKLPAESQALLDKFVTEDYETLKQKSRFAAWAGLLRAAEQKGIRAPSYVTFCRAVAQRPRFDQCFKRQGRRAAYQHESFYWELTRTTPRHGDRPFEIGHVYHTQLDLELASSQTHRVLGRPWMTFLTDAFSRRILAFYLTFDEPSYRSCMMILRECVRRHARLPQITIVDGGAEFRSTYLETLIARFQCTKKTRPPAKGRFGSVIERLFGTTNTQFIHNLSGNTQISRNVRQVTKSVNPKEHAIWTLERLHQRLSEYLFEVYDTADHPALGQSPREAFQSGLEAFGFRPECRIPYNQDFIIATLPTGAKGVAKVRTGCGVKINHIYYWSSSFQDPAIVNQRVPIRYDPFDAGTAYAYVGRRWVQCHSEHYALLHDRSEKELMLASCEIRRQKQQHANRFDVTAKRLGTFLHSVEADEAVLTQ